MMDLETEVTRRILDIRICARWMLAAGYLAPATATIDTAEEIALALAEQGLRPYIYAGDDGVEIEVEAGAAVACIMLRIGPYGPEPHVRVVTEDPPTCTLHCVDSADVIAPACEIARMLSGEDEP